MPTPQQRSGLILRGPVVGAAPAFRTPVATTAGSGVGVSANLPTYLAGDLLFMAVALGGATAIATPANWTLIRRTVVNTSDRNLNTFYKIATGSEGSTVALTFASIQYAIAIGAVLGPAPVLPVEAEDGQANASSVNCVAPSITTLGPNRMLIFAGCAGNRTFTPPTGFTERADIVGSTTVSVTIADATQAAAGATGTVTATVSSAITNGGHIAAIKGA